MNMKNRPVVTDEPVEIQNIRKIMDHFKRNLWNIPHINYEEKSSNQLDLETLGF